MTKVSVIIPVYNVEKYLRQCLESVVNKNPKDIESNMHIFFASDNNFILPLICAMSSILRHAKVTDYHNFYILDKDISEENKERIAKLKKIKDFTIEYIKVNDDLFIDCPLTKDCSHIPLQTYYRYIIPKIKPQLDKVLYLDCDILVMKSLENLWNINLGNTYCGVVQDMYSGTQKDAERLGLKAYFNAGILLLNNRKLVEENFSDVLFKNTYKLLEENNIKWQDQDVLNFSFDNNVIWINPCYNYQQNFYNKWFYTQYTEKDLMYAKSNITILHYNTDNKPWKKQENTKFYKWEYLLEMFKNSFCKEVFYLIIVKAILQNILSVRNESKTHKVITICGIKIKVRRKQHA